MEWVYSFSMTDPEGAKFLMKHSSDMAIKDSTISKLILEAPQSLLQNRSSSNMSFSLIEESLLALVRLDMLASTSDKDGKGAVLPRRTVNS